MLNETFVHYDIENSKRVDFDHDLDSITKFLSADNFFLIEETADNFTDEGIYIDNYTFLEDMQNKKCMLQIFNYLCTTNFPIENTYSVFHLINELDRNVRNHSTLDYEDLFSMAVRYNNGKFTICCLDDGIGFKENLKMDTPVFSAIKEGVTSKSNHEFATEDSKNSGYGLFILSELAKENGEIAIVTNKEYYQLLHGQFCLVDNNFDFNAYPNVIVYFSINLNALTDTINYIQSKATNKSKKSIYDANLNELLIETFDRMNLK